MLRFTQYATRSPSNTVSHIHISLPVVVLWFSLQTRGLYAKTDTPRRTEGAHKLCGRIQALCRGRHQESSESNWMRGQQTWSSWSEMPNMKQEDCQSWYDGVVEHLNAGQSREQHTVKATTVLCLGLPRCQFNPDEPTPSPVEVALSVSDEKSRCINTVRHIGRDGCLLNVTVWRTEAHLLRLWQAVNSMRVCDPGIFTAFRWHLEPYPQFWHNFILDISWRLLSQCVSRQRAASPNSFFSALLWVSEPA